MGRGTNLSDLKDMTMTEKILSLKSGKRASPGEIVIVDVDLVYAHDGTAPLIIKSLYEEFDISRFTPRTKTALFIDHVSPASTVSAAEVHKEMRAFSKRHGIELFDVGRGICHQVASEESLVMPGDLVFGADSHTTTLGAFSAFATGVGSTDAALAMLIGKNWIKVPEPIKIKFSDSLPIGVMGKDVALYLLGMFKAGSMTGKSLEFHNVGALSVDSRMSITNMAAELDADAAIMPTDNKLLSYYITEAGVEVRRAIAPGEGAHYYDSHDIELERLSPMVAVPPFVDNVKGVEEVEGTEIDQVFIGSCTNGRMEDLMAAARILKGRKVKARCIVIPASSLILKRAMSAGIIEILLEAGCVIGPPTCGPCVGAHLGLIASGETVLSTSNRNFSGRMGHKDGKIYLASPLTAGASAVNGKITDPRPYL